MEERILHTACGPLKGRCGKTDGITEFRGIRYATARRFEKPEVVTHWDGLYDATEFGAGCLQSRAYAPESGFYAHEFREGSVFTHSEDCQFLNVWVPEGAEYAPVIFYIHGGAFMGGSGDEKQFTPDAWCKKGVIAVTCNYRLGILGFSNFEAARTADLCGNYGLYDQIAALTWVRDNIASFGGDPNRITVMGQSAGAMSVQQLLLSPLACDLFSGAVLLSGGGLVPMMSPKPAADTFAAWNDFAASLGASTLEDLQAIPADDLMRAAMAAMRERKLPMPQPIVDGLLITDKNDVIARTEGAHPVPCIIGSTSEDMTGDALHAAVKEWAEIQNGLGQPPVYAYYFSRQLPGDDKGAWHSSDLWYYFGSLHHSWRPMQAWDDTLSEAMVTYLTDFAWSGDPNRSGTQPAWLPLSAEQPKMMHFGDDKIEMQVIERDPAQASAAVPGGNHGEMPAIVKDDCIVSTGCGLVKGRPGRTEGITEFRGIRYATARRFEKPEAVTHWNGLYDATEFGAACPQPRMAFPEHPFYAKEFREGMQYTYDEDCLFLNIWVPKGAEYAPVVFYIHGGGFSACCGNEKKFVPDAWCKKGVIAVTCNYRLGVFGFSNFEAAREAGAAGNYGLYDQIAALTWVKDHIADFGGDPNHITVMGQSAGAMSVQKLLLSPLACDLFTGAVMMSGGGLLSPIATRTAEETLPAWNAFAASLGASTLEDLRAIPAEDLMRAHTLAAKNDPMLSASPIVDGELITGDPRTVAETEGARPVPCIMSYTRNDIFPQALHSATDEWAVLQEKQGNPPVYAYFFDHALPGDDKGAWHSCDLWYIFGSLHYSWRPMQAWDDTLSEAMVTYLTDFAWSGDPNRSGTQPVWLPLSAGQTKRLCFGETGIAMADVDPATLKSSL